MSIIWENFCKSGLIHNWVCWAINSVLLGQMLEASDSAHVCSNTPVLWYFTNVQSLFAFCLGASHITFRLYPLSSQIDIYAFTSIVSLASPWYGSTICFNLCHFSYLPRHRGAVIWHRLSAYRGGVIKRVVGSCPFSPLSEGAGALLIAFPVSLYIIETAECSLHWFWWK